MKTKNKTFSLPKTTLQKLKEYQVKTMIPQSSLIGRLLEDFFKNEEKIKNK